MLEAKNYPVIKHFVGTNAESFDLEKTLTQLCHQLSRHCKGGIRNYNPPASIAKLLSEFPKMLEYAARRRTVQDRVVIVIDGCNQMYKDFDAELMNWIPASIPSEVGWVRGFFGRERERERTRTCSMQKIDYSTPHVTLALRLTSSSPSSPSFVAGPGRRVVVSAVCERVQLLHLPRNDHR